MSKSSRFFALGIFVMVGCGPVDFQQNQRTSIPKSVGAEAEQTLALSDQGLGPLKRLPGGDNERYNKPYNDLVWCQDDYRNKRSIIMGFAPRRARVCMDEASGHRVDYGRDGLVCEDGVRFTNLTCSEIANQNTVIGWAHSGPATIPAWEVSYRDVSGWDGYECADANGWHSPGSKWRKKSSPDQVFFRKYACDYWKTKPNSLDPSQHWVDIKIRIRFRDHHQSPVIWPDRLYSCAESELFYTGNQYVSQSKTPVYSNDEQAEEYMKTPFPGNNPFRNSRSRSEIGSVELVGKDSFGRGLYSWGKANPPPRSSTISFLKDKITGSVTILKGSCQAMSQLTGLSASIRSNVFNKAQRQVKLAWQTPFFADDFVIERKSLTSDHWYQVGSIASTTHSSGASGYISYEFVDPSVLGPGNYLYRLTPVVVGIRHLDQHSINITVPAWEPLSSFEPRVGLISQANNGVLSMYSAVVKSSQAKPDRPSTQTMAVWSTAVEWDIILSGDFDGDGQQDVAGKTETGSWWVSRSVSGRPGGPQEFSTTHWGTWSAAVDWDEILVGDFTGDGKDDIAGMANGQWWVAESSGISFATFLWGKWDPAAIWQDVLVLDANGDGKADLAGRANGQWMLAKSYGGAFATVPFGVWSDVEWVDTKRIDFNGDGKDDIVGRHHGQWWLAESNGTASTNRFLGEWSNEVVWRDVLVGDFDGDGAEDIAGRANGAWWISRGGEAGFETSLWTVWSNDIDWQHVQVIDENKDAIMGMAANGTWWLSMSNGSAFNTPSLLQVVPQGETIVNGFGFVLK